MNLTKIQYKFSCLLYDCGNDCDQNDRDRSQELLNPVSRISYFLRMIWQKMLPEVGKSTILSSFGKILLTSV